MQALVLIAHGSRREASNQEVRDLAHRLQRAASDRFQLVETGFLEIADPSIPQAIESSIRAGATSVAVVPYFLAAGRHVAEDIPRIVKAVAERHRPIAIQIAPYIGRSDSMIQLILESASSLSTHEVDTGLLQTA